MIEVEDLVVSYKGLKALNSICLTIKKGESLALVGQNGAGKSSLLKALIGLISNYSGNISTIGSIGWMPENSTPDANLKVFEFLNYCGYLKGIKKDRIIGVTNSALEMCGLSNKRETLCSSLSKGLKQRVILASALIGDPDILILDEPSSGLDPLFQSQMISLIERLKVNKTLILSTHNVSEIENLCSRVVVLRDGYISFDSSKDTKGDKSYYEFF